MPKSEVPSDKLDAFLEIIEDWDKEACFWFITELFQKRPELMDIITIDKCGAVSWTE